MRENKSLNRRMHLGGCSTLGAWDLLLREEVVLTTAGGSVRIHKVRVPGTNTPELREAWTCRRHRRDPAQHTPLAGLRVCFPLLTSLSGFPQEMPQALARNPPRSSTHCTTPSDCHVKRRDV